MNGCGVPVVVAGGPKAKTDNEFCEMVYGSIQAGGAGVAAGRNVFQHKDPTKMVKVLCGIVHENMNPEVLDYLFRAISQPIALGEMKFPTLKSLRKGQATGILVGGNMSLIISAIGTPYDINTDNTVLFLEDIGEHLESIDSYLMHLKLAGKFKKVKGIVFGKMIDCIDSPGKRYWDQESHQSVTQ